LEWRSNIDFSTNIDKLKYNPDNGYPSTDKYESTNTRISLSNNFIYQLDKSSFFNKLTLNTSIRQGFEKIEQVKLIQLSGPRSFSLATEQGENVGFYPNLRYVANFSTEGRPLDITALFRANGVRKTGGITHSYEAGLDWRYSKNNGKGLQYDMRTPPSASVNIERPRAYDELPASNLLSAFFGDQMSYALDQHKFTLYAGLRTQVEFPVQSSASDDQQLSSENRYNFRVWAFLQAAYTPDALSE
jgi:hypothetical protein